MGTLIVGPVAAVPSIRLLKRNNLHVGYKKGAA